MNIISNRCFGALLLQTLNEPFVNPFIWSASPYDSIIYTMNNYGNIDWYNYDISKSTITQNTFVISVEDNIHLHFVHHIFDPSCKVPVVEKDNDWHGEIRYCRIWENINDNYLRRINRMRYAEPPIFLIVDQMYPMPNKSSLKDIVFNKTDYKRLVITTDKSLDRNDNICRILHIDYMKDFKEILDEKMNDIMSFIQ